MERFIIFSFWFKGSGGSGTKAVQGAEKLRMSNLEWKILWKKGLRGEEGCERPKSREKATKRVEIEQNVPKPNTPESEAAERRGQTFNAKSQRGKRINRRWTQMGREY
jgi:hypothetical protein